ncbi:MAG: FAD-dependent oxidoreductase [Gemmatimonadetes bacterium]|nr:FAD-dependent oxidoreductase [Gemmatimonadota bacterium]
MDHPIRVAIIGAGPAGFFTAEALFKQGASVEIDIFNRYPPPFGLVRDGVAPDHEPIKSVTKVYQRLLDRPEVRYLGNVEIGRDLAIEELRSFYHHIVYAFGAQSDRRLGIPGEDLEGSAPATTFVGWYNGHPAYADAAFDLSVEDVVVIGNGNVAIDVARILVLPMEVLEKTDIADHALEGLRRSRVRRVTLLGRRGPAQAAFTNPELREFGRIAGVSVNVLPNELDLDTESARAVEEDRTRSRNLSTLRAYAEADVAPGPKEVRFRFLTSPIEILGEEGRVTGVRVERNRLAPSPSGRLQATGTGEIFDLSCGMVLRSVGYLGTPVPGVPHETYRGTVPNEDGRVLGEDGAPLPGEYVVGWAKRGPSGVIGTNKADAAATVQAMLEDSADGVFAGEGPGTDPRRLLDDRGVQWIDEAAWARLDAYERTQGEPFGRPRVKVCSVEEMLRIARS